MEYSILRDISDCTTIQPESIASFLFKHLDEFGDDLESIRMAIDHAFGATGAQGGFVLTVLDQQQLIGALVMNRTGMSRYIPENVLVYVAVHHDHRGQGIGRELVERALQLAEGDVKLHVEYQNPAKRLYERIGFTTKYAEMRFSKRR